MTEHKIDDSLAVRRTEMSQIPFTAEELLVLGRKYAQARRLGMAWQEDAAQEFAIGGLAAIKRATAEDNIRAYQIKAGKWAVANLWRTMHRKKRHEDDFKRDRYGIVDRYSRIDPEILTDHCAPDSLVPVLEDEKRSILRQAINRLPEIEREVLCAIVYEQKRLKEIAQERSMGTSNVCRIYQQGVQLLKDELAKK